MASPDGFSLSTRTAALYALFLAVVAIAVIIYLHYSAALQPEFDDAFYIYSIEMPTALRGSTFSGSFGFMYYGYIFYLLLGSKLITPSVIAISAVVLTAFVILLTFRKFYSTQAGIFASILYMFNPLVTTYAGRLLPDIFTALFLSLGIYAALHGERRGLRYYLLGGLITALGFFFGIQALFTSIAYLAIALALVYRKIGLETVAYPIVGLAIGFGVYSLAQFAMYGNPFAMIAQLSNQFGYITTPHSLVYFEHTLFQLGQSPVGGKVSEPYANMGILTILFMISCFSVSAKDRMKVLPYVCGSLAFVLYILFGTSSIFHYVPIIDVSRYLVPAALLFSLCIAVAINELSPQKLRHMLMAAAVLLYMPALVNQAPAVAQFFSYSNAALTSLQGQLSVPGLEGVAVYENYYSVSSALCYFTHTTPQNCTVILGAAPCSQASAVLILRSPSCGANYTTHNSTFGYYIYRNG